MSEQARVLIPPRRSAVPVEVEESYDIAYTSLASEDQEVLWDHSAEADFAGGSFEPEGWCEVEDTGEIAAGVRVTPVAQRAYDGARTDASRQCYLVEMVVPAAYPPAYYRLQMRRKGYR